MSKKCLPGDIVLIDNLASHKSLKIGKAIEAMGAERSVEALATSCAFKRRVQQINDQSRNQASGAYHDKYGIWAHFILLFSFSYDLKPLIANN
jgi:hypothetical protein